MKNISILSLFIVLITISSCASKKGKNSTTKNIAKTTYIKKDILTKNEADDLLLLIEEEKLARDVYMYSYEKYKAEIFHNISLSEQQHINKVSFLLIKYGLKNPSKVEIGKFNNVKYQELYNKLIAQSDISLIEALKVGATIEDLDIFDINDFMSRTNDADITNVYKKLNCGSKNHIRSFIKQLKKNNATYTPQFLSQEKLKEILKGFKEQCNKKMENRKGQGHGQGKGKGHGQGRGQGQGRGKNRNIGF